jgi:cytochrome c
MEIAGAGSVRSSLMQSFGFVLACSLCAVSGNALADGDPVRGEVVFLKCAPCHSAEPGINKVGPSLHGVVDQPAASLKNYIYSAAMKAFGAAGQKWDEANLIAYLKGPAKGFLPGTRMAFAGLRTPEDIADVIAYLRTTNATTPPQNPPPE